MLYAEPQLNGNEPRDFATAAMALQIARDRTADALKVMHSHVLHGRNYQHTDPRNRTADLDSMIPLTLALSRMDALITDLARKANKK
jgi:hypothetical protein